jgi:hypothetical protein
MAIAQLAEARISYSDTELPQGMDGAKKSVSVRARAHKNTTPCSLNACAQKL